jgi:hypothetical protein
MRFRIVAAASTRPRLKEMIGKSQARLTEDLCALTAFAQSKQWLRDDVSPKALSVLFQILVFGRALDDVSNDPVEEAAWEQMIGVLFLDLLSK